MGLGDVVAVGQVVSAVGLLAFWRWWLWALRAGRHDTSWWPEGHADHERAFALPDHVLALVLLAAAGGWWAGAGWAPGLSLFAAGLTGFLAMLDATYFTQQKMWAPERDGLGNMAIVGGLGLLVVLTLIAHL